MKKKLDPATAAHLAAHEGEAVHEVITDYLLPDSPGIVDPVGAPLAVPRSAFALPVECDDCGTATPAEDGDALDLEHAEGCHLAEVLAGERRRDEALLSELVHIGLPAVVVRKTHESEVALQASRGVDAARHEVVVTTDDQGHRRRRWPALADD